MHASDLPRTIPAALDRAVEQFGDREALVDGDVRLTWRQLAAEIDVAARALLASGIEKGDRVAIWSPNIGEWVDRRLRRSTGSAPPSPR